MDDLELARRHAPIVYFDAAEPFLPELVGYRVLRRSGPSPSFDRYLTLDVPEVGRAAAVVEYALWTDWDIQHLYELEHVWSYVDEQGKLLFAEASWHGRLGALIQDGRLSQEGERPLAYAQPGKHAMAPTPEVFSRFDLLRSGFARACGPEAGNDGMLVTPVMHRRLEKSARADGLANAWLRQRAFVPTWRFERRWEATDVPWHPIGELLDKIPRRLADLLAGLEAERARHPLWAVLFDLGDTLMVEETEEKDETATTQRAELFSGAADALWRLRREGYLLGLVADTRPGTYRNVLRQHGLDRVFDVFAISEELGCEKPDRRMFDHVMTAFGLRPEEAGRVAMVGNNLSRDVCGANRCGMASIWLRHNTRYPLEPAHPSERPRFSAAGFDELGHVLERLGRVVP
ncbi:MAG TPA: HAD hydrolase-like protein [Chloroflexota bacterium]|nr:HAD hydrolase-like protein [Chloroflexota bacterium]